MVTAPVLSPASQPKLPALKQSWSTRIDVAVAAELAGMRVVRRRKCSCDETRESSSESRAFSIRLCRAPLAAAASKTLPLSGNGIGKT
jgi:hypothetical protein